MKLSRITSDSVKNENEYIIPINPCNTFNFHLLRQKLQEKGLGSSLPGSNDVDDRRRYSDALRNNRRL